MLCADTGIIGNSGLLLGLVLFPRADTFVNVLCKAIVLAIAVVV
jgi:hypothetical protein